MKRKERKNQRKKKNGIAMLEEIKVSKKTKQRRRYRARQKAKNQTNKQRKPFGASYKRNEWKKTKAFQKENEIRKAVIRTQRWRLRIKLQKDNTDKQPTVPEKNTVK
jgi:hypothetical protein